MSKSLLLKLSIGLNIILVLILSVFALKRYKPAEWKKFAQQYTSNMPYDQLILVGDSQLDNFKHMGFLEAYRHTNLAVPGQTVQGLQKRLASWKVDPKQHQVLLLSGINDLRYGSDVNQLIEHYQEVVQKLDALYPNSQIFLLGLLPIENENPINLEASNKKILEFNQRVKIFGDSLQIPFLSYFELLSIDGQLNPAYSMDGLHLNASGNQLLFQALSGFINQK